MGIYPKGGRKRRAVRNCHAPTTPLFKQALFPSISGPARGGSRLNSPRQPQPLMHAQSFPLNISLLHISTAITPWHMSFAKQSFFSSQSPAGEAILSFRFMLPWRGGGAY